MDQTSRAALTQGMSKRRPTLETEPTDVGTDVDSDDEADLPDLEWLAGEANAYPPEYYLDQENNSDESEDEDEDYSDGSLRLLVMIKGNFHRWVPYSLLACRLLLSNR